MFDNCFLIEDPASYASPMLNHVKTSQVLVVSAFLSLLFLSQASAEESRADFVKKMELVHQGMSAEQVTAILGKPDDIVTPYDPGDNYGDDWELWGYGADGHLSFPTLGVVRLVKGKVNYIRGDRGAPPAGNVISEAELRTALRQIHAADESNPLSMIRVVNRLLPMGKEKILAALSEHERVSSLSGFDGYESFLLLRLLFQVPSPPGYMPEMRVGGPEPEGPKDKTILPLFPAALIDEVPIYLVYGYVLAGQAEPVEFHIDYFRKNGVLRTRPLRPTDDPLGVLPKLEASPGWLYGFDPMENDRGKGYIANQLLRLVATVYRAELNPDGECSDFYTGGHFDQRRWNAIVKAVADLHIHWDASQNHYVFSDGSSLPELPKPNYRRVIWETPELGDNTCLILERLNAKWIRVTQTLDLEGHLRVHPVLTFHAVDGGNRALYSVTIPGSSGEFETEFPVTAGEQIRAELSFRGKTRLSPTSVP